MKQIDTSKIPVQELTWAEQVIQRYLSMNIKFDPKNFIKQILSKIWNAKKKVIDAVQKGYSFNLISQDDYDKKINQLLDTFTKMSSKIENFDLDIFTDNYDLKSCTWAVDLLKMPKNKKNSHEASDILQLNNLLIELDSFLVYNPMIQIYQIKEKVFDILNKINKVESKEGTLDGSKLIQEFYQKIIQQQLNEEFNQQDRQIIQIYRQTVLNSLLRKINGN